MNSHNHPRMVKEMHALLQKIGARRQKQRQTLNPRRTMDAIWRERSGGCDGSALSKGYRSRRSTGRDQTDASSPTQQLPEVDATDCEDREGENASV